MPLFRAAEYSSCRSIWHAPLAPRALLHSSRSSPHRNPQDFFSKFRLGQPPSLPRQPLPPRGPWPQVPLPRLAPRLSPSLLPLTQSRGAPLSQLSPSLLPACLSVRSQSGSPSQPACAQPPSPSLPSCCMLTASQPAYLPACTLPVTQPQPARMWAAPASPHVRCHAAPTCLPVACS